MDLEICLRPAMRRFEIAPFGAQTKMLEFFERTGRGKRWTDRGPLRRLLNNELTKVDLERLGDVCDWLLNEVDETRTNELRAALPGCLLRRAGLWERLLRSPSIAIALAEKNLITRKPGLQRYAPARKWVSSRDTMAAMEIVYHLSKGGPIKDFKTVLVPFYFPEAPTRFKTNDQGFSEMQEKARRETEKQLEELRGKSGALLVIGSQRVNLMTELLVAKHYGAAPFRPDPERKVPFYMRYRRNDPEALDSCFGGKDGPIGTGLHYRVREQSRTKWKHMKWVDGEQAVGILTVDIDEENDRREICLFGFSGECTLEIGMHFCANPDAFFPGRNERYASFACRIPLAESAGTRPDIVRVS